VLHAQQGVVLRVLRRQAREQQQLLLHDRQQLPFGVGEAVVDEHVGELLGSEPLAPAVQELLVGEVHAEEDVLHFGGVLVVLLHGPRRRRTPLRSERGGGDHRLDGLVEVVVRAEEKVREPLAPLLVAEDAQHVPGPLPHPLVPLVVHQLRRQQPSCEAVHEVLPLLVAEARVLRIGVVGGEVRLLNAKQGLP
jgi:hypothetical protein